MWKQSENPVDFFFFLILCVIYGKLSIMNDYVVIYSNRKTLGLEVSAEKGVIVRAPRRASQKEIERFVASHAVWIERAKARVQTRAANRPVFSDDPAEIARLKKLAKECWPIVKDAYSYVFRRERQDANPGETVVTTLT